jgi:hypothetical protein
MRGRVMGLDTLTFFGCAPFGNLAIGTLGDECDHQVELGMLRSPKGCCTKELGEDTYEWKMRISLSLSFWRCSMRRIYRNPETADNL